MSGSVILILNPSPQTKSTDDYAAGNIDADKSLGKSAAANKVDERNRLLTALSLLIPVLPCARRENKPSNWTKTPPSRACANHRSSTGIRRGVNDARVAEMRDGGMGSIRFLGGTDRRRAGSLAQAKYVDDDGVTVSIELNVDEEYE